MENDNHVAVPNNDYLATLIQERQRERDQVRRNPLADEFTLYWESNHPLGRNADPLLFWKVHENEYSNLASVARDVFAVPATSAPVERVFSQASIATNGKRTRLSGKQLEREIMLKTNKVYF